MKNLILKISALGMSMAIVMILISAKPTVVPEKDFAGTSELDVTYGHNTNIAGQDQQLQLDVYWPANAVKGKKYPFVLLIHGGSFLTGKKEVFSKACQILADSGFVAATINYRMGWKHGRGESGCDADIPDFIRAQYFAFQDANAAMRYLVSNADKYCIDKNWLFAGGASAGAATALGMQYDDQAYTDKMLPGVSKRFGGLYDRTNDLKANFKIKGICDMWGGVTDSALITSRKAVPTILFHGTADHIAPYDHGRWVNQNCENYPFLCGSACIYRRLLASQVPAVFNSITNGKHGPVELSAEHIMSNTACFFHSVINGRAHSGFYVGPKIGCLN